MNKYYTPEIEEFHDGFEFELETLDKGEWEKDIYKHGEDINIYLNDSIRVKYLDKEDIESLGFTLISNVNGFSTFKRGEHILRLFIKDSNEYTIEDPGNIVFQGIIKNKSELKKLLKQLNIK